MSRLLVLFVALFLITATTLTFAQSENSNSRGNSSSNRGSSDVTSNSQGKNGTNKKVDVNLVESSSSGQASPTCAPEAQWKNHGDYVSCVARLHLGGKTVSEAARSDIGKKRASTASASINPSPTASSSASESATPAPTASESATPTASLLGGTEIVQQFEAFGQLIKEFVHNLRSVFSL
jgi:hypothetical protein